MLSGRALAIALAVFAVLWAAFALRGVSSDPALPDPASSLGVLAVVFAIGAWVMHAGGRPERVPLLVGTALGCAAYVALHAAGVAP